MSFAFRMSFSLQVLNLILGSLALAQSPPRRQSALLNQIRCLAISAKRSKLRLRKQPIDRNFLRTSSSAIELCQGKSPNFPTLYCLP